MSYDLATRILGLRPGVDRLDESDAPADVDAGLAVSVDVLHRRLGGGEQLAGWKVGFSAGPSRDVFADGFRPFGGIVGSRRFPTGDTVPLDAFVDCRVEHEIALILAAPLSGGGVTTEQARAAVGSVAAAFELCDVRVPLQLPLLAADNMTNWGVVVGDEQPTAEFDAMSVAAVLTENGEERARGEAAGWLDDPFLSLARLCAALDRYDLGVEPGHVVLTGAFAACEAKQPGHWRAELSGIGAVEVTFV